MRKWVFQSKMNHCYCSLAFITTLYIERRLIGVIVELCLFMEKETSAKRSKKKNKQNKIKWNENKTEHKNLLINYLCGKCERIWEYILFVVHCIVKQKNDHNAAFNSNEKCFIDSFFGLLEIMHFISQSNKILTLIDISIVKYDFISFFISLKQGLYMRVLEFEQVNPTTTIEKKKTKNKSSNSNQIQRLSVLFIVNWHFIFLFNVFNHFQMRNLSYLKVNTRKIKQKHIIIAFEFIVCFRAMWLELHLIQVLVYLHRNQKHNQ